MRQSLLIERRALLRAAAVGLAASVTASKALAAACANPDGGDSSLRESLHYTESAADSAQRCSACGFFSSPSGACGHCAIFNGAANANGHCDSWAARP
jgi:hypothetical protein